MATGELNFSSEGQEVSKFDRTPPPTGDYDFILKSQGASIQSAQEPGSVPYVGKIRLELLGSAQEEGQPNKSVFASMYLSMKPGKDGKVNPHRQNGLLALAKSLGESYSLPGREFTAAVKVDGKPTGEFETIPMLDPDATKALVQSWDGRQGRVHILTKPVKNKDGSVSKDEKRAEVDYFIEAAASSGADFGGDQEQEEAPPPPPKPATKPAAKPATPAKKAPQAPAKRR